MKELFAFYVRNPTPVGMSMEVTDLACVGRHYRCWFKSKRHTKCWSKDLASGSHSVEERAGGRGGGQHPWAIPKALDSQRAATWKDGSHFVQSQHRDNRILYFQSEDLMTADATIPK